MKIDYKFQKTNDNFMVIKYTIVLRYRSFQSSIYYQINHQVINTEQVLLKQKCGIEKTFPPFTMGNLQYFQKVFSFQ